MPNPYIKSDGRHYHSTIRIKSTKVTVWAIYWPRTGGINLEIEDKDMTIDTYINRLRRQFKNVPFKIAKLTQGNLNLMVSDFGDFVCRNSSDKRSVSNDWIVECYGERD